MDPNPIKPGSHEPHTDEQPPTRAMRQALGRLLDQVPGTREVLTHLAALERILKTYGLASLDRMPLAVLDRVVVQLGSLPVKPGDRALQSLLALLVSTLERRLHEASIQRPISSTVDGDRRWAVGDSDPAPLAPGAAPAGHPGRQPR